MGIITIMKMELKFIASQGFTSLLILLYPFILMVIVGPVFSSLTGEDAYIAVHNGMDEPFPALNSKGINFVDSKDAMVSEVLSGKAVLGITIVKDEKGRRRMYAYYEPSKRAIANALALQVQGQLADLTAELVETNLVSIWDNMREVSNDIDAKLQELPKLRRSLDDSKIRMQNLRSNLEAQQISSTSNSLNTMQNDISSMQTSIGALRGRLSNWDNSINEISNFDSKLAYYDSRLLSSDNQLAALQSSLGTWDYKLAQRISQLDSIYISLNNYLQIVRNIKVTSTGEQLNQLNQVEAGILDAMNQVNSARNDLQQMRNEIGNMQSQVTNSRNEIAIARSDIQSTRSRLASTSSSARNDVNYMRSQLADAENKLNSANSNIANAQNSFSSFSNLENSVDSYLADSATEIDSLQRELDGTQALLSNAKMNIDKFISKDPQKYIPTKMDYFSEKKEIRPIDSIFPAIVGLVSMLSCLLLPPIMSVKQKAQGMRMRVKLSYTNTSSIIVGRFLGDYLVGLVQVLVVTLMGSLIFGINLGSDYVSLLVALMIAPAVFTALGTFIASFISNEGSAVLSSLLISMPLLFLSGAILPLEQISASFRSIAALLPLYNVIELISKLTVRDSAAFIGNNLLICISYLVIFIFLSYLFWRNKE